MNKKEKILLENYILNLLFEKGRFSKFQSSKNLSKVKVSQENVDLDAWLIGINCDQKLFSSMFDQYNGSKRIYLSDEQFEFIHKSCYIFEKNQNIIDHIKSFIPEESIDRVGGEFKDELPVFICVNVGNFLDKGKVNLVQDNLDWMVHDIWHRIVDFAGWYDYKDYRMSRSTKDIINKYSMLKDVNRYRELSTIYQNDALIFLKHYGFTEGVGGMDFIQSLGAFTIMNRHISQVDETIFRDKMEDYEDFKEFYQNFHSDSLEVWEKIIGLFQNNVVCLNSLS